MLTDYITSKKHKEKLRLVKFYDEEQGRMITGTVPLISSCDHFFSKALVK